jgi:hypothetical protein
MNTSDKVNRNQQGRFKFALNRGFLLGLLFFVLAKVLRLTTGLISFVDVFNSPQTLLELLFYPLLGFLVSFFIAWPLLKSEDKQKK